MEAAVARDVRLVARTGGSVVDILEVPALAAPALAGVVFLVGVGFSAAVFLGGVDFRGARTRAAGCSDAGAWPDSAAEPVSACSMGGERSRCTEDQMGPGRFIR